MANIIEMPKLSDTMTVGTLVKWLKKEGDAVKTGDMLAEVETDKATMEVESVVSGVLAEVRAGVNDAVSVGQLIAAQVASVAQLVPPALRQNPSVPQ